MTRQSVDDIWDTLNASHLTNRLNQSYKNSKIPFAFNYSNGEFDVSNTYAGSDHGTHVAGIAAANKIADSRVVGVAPDAQLVVMQVFSSGGGAGWATILAALEDCVRLKVDSVNLSLAPLPVLPIPPDMIEVMKQFQDSDIQVLIAAGNDTNNAQGNHYGLNKSLLANPDTGLVGTPATTPPLCPWLPWTTTAIPSCISPWTARSSAIWILPPRLPPISGELPQQGTEICDGPRLRCRQ